MIKYYRPGPSPLHNNDPPVKLAGLFPQPGLNRHDAISLPLDLLYTEPPNPEDKKAVTEYNKL
jgi:hypothetical protein